MNKLSVVLLVFAISMSGDIGLMQDEGEVHTITVDGFGSNLRFVPDTLTINEGDTVRFLWSDQLLPHNAIELNELFDSGDAMRDVDYTYTFGYNQSGIYEFYCEPHRDLGMIGEITVVDVELDNMSGGDDIETKLDDSVGENSSKVRLGMLVGLVFIMLLFVYYRTKIDSIIKL